MKRPPKKRERHGMHGTREYTSWCEMFTRCRNKKREKYKRYGGRGIKVCDRWQWFTNFYADMGKRPIGTTLDRIDNDGDYTPENCRWATIQQQMQNHSKLRLYKHKGKVMCLTTICRSEKMVYETVIYRMDIRGWSLQKALSTPLERSVR